MLIIGELKVDTFNPPQVGGFSVNRCASAVGVTHIPTGIMCQSSSKRGVHANREKALEMLWSQLPAEYKMEEPASDDALTYANVLDRKVTMERSRRANFQREWPRIPRSMQRRIKELMLPGIRARDFLYCQGVLQGYAVASEELEGRLFEPAYAVLIVQAMQDREEWVLDEVRHASVSK